MFAHRQSSVLLIVLASLAVTSCVEDPSIRTGSQVDDLLSSQGLSTDFWYKKAQLLVSKDKHEHAWIIWAYATPTGGDGFPCVSQVRSWELIYTDPSKSPIRDPEEDSRVGYFGQTDGRGCSGTPAEKYAQLDAGISVAKVAELLPALESAARCPTLGDPKCGNWYQIAVHQYLTDEFLQIPQSYVYSVELREGGGYTVVYAPPHGELLVCEITFNADGSKSLDTGVRAWGY